MYDSITLILHTTVEPSYQKLANLVEVKNIDTGLTTSRGKLKNLMVSYRVGKLVVSGSLAKYFLGDNLQVLTRASTAKAIQQLGDDLGLSLTTLESAKVVRLEIGTNLVMKEPIAKYLQILGFGKFYKHKNTYDSTTNFYNKRKSIQFYSKGAELKEKKQAIPFDFSNTNILRIELKYQNKLSQQLGQGVTASKLYEESFYMLMIDKLKEQYESITKLPSVETPDITSTKELIDYFAYLGIKHYFSDPNNIFQIIDNMQISRQNKIRMKEKVKTLLSKIKGEKNTSLVDELDSKFYQSIAYYR